jgi:transposase-like protein
MASFSQIFCQVLHLAFIVKGYFDFIIYLFVIFLGHISQNSRGAGGKNIVFGILERDGKVSVNIVKDVSAETLNHETAIKVRRGSRVYTDKWKGDDSLMFCGYTYSLFLNSCVDFPRYIRKKDILIIPIKQAFKRS